MKAETEEKKEQIFFGFVFQKALRIGPGKQKHPINTCYYEHDC